MYFPESLMAILEIANEKEFSASSNVATNFVLSIVNGFPFFNHSILTGTIDFFTMNLADAFSSQFTIISST